MYLKNLKLKLFENSEEAAEFVRKINMFDMKLTCLTKFQKQVRQELQEPIHFKQLGWITVQPKWNHILLGQNDSNGDKLINYQTKIFIQGLQCHRNQF